ncbi:MAG: hypothetical protein EP344_06675 [Bacteroidetes bacterium]|nr:MAG: hypothetical protein EP344_06675 [Bacteroidota bacterium]
MLPFRKHHIFLFYWVLMLSMGGYLIYDHQPDYHTEIEPYLVGTMQRGLLSTENWQDAEIMEMHKQADAWNIPLNDSIRRQAQAAIEQSKVLKKKVLALKTSDQPIDLPGLSRLLRQFGDSLLLFTSQDAVIAAELDTLIFQPAAALTTDKWAAFFKNARPSTVRLFLDDLAWKTQLALFPVLEYASAKQIKIARPRLHMLPILTNNQCTVPGEPLKADIELVGYVNEPEQLTFYVNGKPCPAANSIATYEMVYAKPGTYTNKMEIRVKHPSFDQAAIYTNEFEIHVLKP